MITTAEFYCSLLIAQAVELWRKNFRETNNKTKQILNKKTSQQINVRKFHQKENFKTTIAAILKISHVYVKSSN